MSQIFFVVKSNPELTIFSCLSYFLITYVIVFKFFLNILRFTHSIALLFKISMQKYLLEMLPLTDMLHIEQNAIFSLVTFRPYLAYYFL